MLIAHYVMNCKMKENEMKTQLMIVAEKTLRLAGLGVELLITTTGLAVKTIVTLGVVASISTIAIMAIIGVVALALVGGVAVAAKTVMMVVSSKVATVLAVLAVLVVAVVTTSRTYHYDQMRIKGREQNSYQNNLSPVERQPTLPTEFSSRLQEYNKYRSQ